MSVLRVVNWELRLRNSYTAVPFQYGAAKLTACPQALLMVTTEYDGSVQTGYSADCLPPLWFDKSPNQSYREQIQNMVNAVEASAEKSTELSECNNPLDLALALGGTIHEELEQPPLLKSFGDSMVERAVIDGACRLHKATFSDLITQNIICDDRKIKLITDQGRVIHSGIWNRDERHERIAVRHTIGLGDSVAEEVDRGDMRLGDIAKRDGLRYFKVKVANRGQADVQRVLMIAMSIENAVGLNYQITLDGNEQFSSFGQFNEFFKELCSCPDLQNFVSRIIAIEQPLHRSYALDGDAVEGLEEFSQNIPVIIDESDEAWNSFANAVEVGYTGTSSKGCKGIFKALCNRAQIDSLQQGHSDRSFLLTGEDLCCLGPVALQSDLCVVSFMGLEHVERNGHHYFNGLDYLPNTSFPEIMRAHEDLYEYRNDIPVLRIRDGEISLLSINANGFGCAMVPAWEFYTPHEEWDYESLGIPC